MRKQLLAHFFLLRATPPAQQVWICHDQHRGILQVRDRALQGEVQRGRKFQVDFTKSGRHMGTFHLIDGLKVRIYYPGNPKTCGRFHKSGKDCPEGRIAKVCEENGGVRRFLSDHMRSLWAEVNFTPVVFELGSSFEKVELDSI